MRIEYERYSTLMSTVNELFYGKHIAIYEASREKTPEGRRITFGVNWAAMGTVTAEETKKFAENLKDAAATVNLLNSMEIVYYYNEDEPEADWDALAGEIRIALEGFSRWHLADALTIK